jgi:multidrug efflux pump
MTTTKQSPDLTMVVHLFSPTGRYDEVYLRNYATLQVKDVLARIPGRGRRADLRLGRLRHAHLAQPGQDRRAQSDRQRRGRRHPRTKCAGRRRRDWPAAGREPVDFELQINAKGRLVSPEEFGRIIVKTGPNGEKTLLKDIARIELSADSYALRSLLEQQDRRGAAHLSNSRRQRLQLSADVRRTMEELKKNFPDGVDYSVVYDPTVFVRHSIEAVVHTLLEAILLVVIVVIVFLQTWRASIIPLAAVPVSLIGTFAVMLAFGFSINNLSLFGLVLAIGIVVDDAIVVVENVERNIALGLSPWTPPNAP